MSEAAVSYYLEDYERFRASRPVAPASPQRAQALEFLQTHGFPTRRMEQWKYTDITPITRRKFTIGDAVATQADAALIDKLRFTRLDCHELVFINGHFCAQLSNLGELAPGATVRALQTQAQDNATVAARYFGDEDLGQAFTALNAVFLDDGALLHLPTGTALSRPLHIIYFSTDNTDTPHISHPHNKVVLGRHASASVIETYAGVPDARYFTNTHTSILAQAGARLDYYKIQHESQRAYHIGNTRIRQDADSRVDCHALTLGAKLARWDIDVDLNEPGAEVMLNGLYLGNNSQHLDNHTVVRHKQPHTTSREHYRGIMDGRARAVFNGKVIVHEQAQKTEAHQSNANLLLSDAAEVDTKPELEIYADDVKCSHGATVGQLDENMLFYLRSRAVNEDTARSLLTYAFADEIVRDIRLPELRARLEQGIVGELPDTDVIKEFMQ